MISRIEFENVRLWSFEVLKMRKSVEWNDKSFLTQLPTRKFVFSKIYF